MGILERIKEIEQEMDKTQRNKATEGHLGMLKARLAKLRSELLTPSSGGGGGQVNFPIIVVCVLRPRSCVEVLRPLLPLGGCMWGVGVHLFALSNWLTLDNSVVLRAREIGGEFHAAAKA